MPKFYSLENPKKDKVDALLEEIKKYPDLRPRLAFLFPLSEGRKNALDMLESGEITNLKKVEELLESKDFIEREAGFYILGNSFYRDTGISAKMKNLLDAIYEEKYKKEDLADSVKMNVLIASHKEKAFPKIEKIIGQGLTSERLAAVRALIFGGIDKNKAIGFLEKTDFSNNDWARESIAEGLDIFGEESLPLLEKFISDKDNNIKIRAIKTKIGIITASQKEKALPFLEKMAHYDDWRVRMAVVANLLSIGDAASSLLEELLNDEIPDVRRKAEEISNILKHEPHKWLLGSRKSLFATNYTKEMTQRLSVLQNIVNETEKKFNDRFLGIIVVGSVEKGYFNADENSDLDVIILAKDYEVSEYIHNKAKYINICKGVMAMKEVSRGKWVENYIDFSRKIEDKDELSVLFGGLFWGNRKKLLELQNNILNKMNNNDWDEIRNIMLSGQTRLFKAASRFEINSVKLERIKVFTALSKVPPNYVETLEIVNSQLSMIK